MGLNSQYGEVLTHTDFDGNVATYSYYTSYGNGGEIKRNALAG